MNLRRSLAIVGVGVLLVLGLVGVEAWKRIAPVLGWVDPVIDMVTPAHELSPYRGQP